MLFICEENEIILTQSKSLDKKKTKTIIVMIVCFNI